MIGPGDERGPICCGRIECIATHACFAGQYASEVGCGELRLYNIHRMLRYQTVLYDNADETIDTFILEAAVLREDRACV